MGLLNQIRYFGSIIREKKKDLTRSSHWALVRRKFLKSNPCCSACGAKSRLQVHHVKPFHLYPDLELVEDNLITLCMGRSECHLLVGHGGNYRSYNPKVRSDAALIRKDPGRRTEIIGEAKKNRVTVDD